MSIEEKKVVLDVVENGKIWLIGINRPEVRNCVDPDTADLLSSILIRFDRDEVGCVAVVYGVGGWFCSGADLNVVSGEGRGFSVAPVVDLDDNYDRTGPMGFSRLILKKPVIAAVEGFAVAGGLELACWCDMRVVGKEAVFGVFCRRWGVPLIDGGTVRLPLLIGLSRAMDMILTGRAVSAEEALEIGLANRVVERGEALSEAILLAQQLCNYPQNTMRTDRISALSPLAIKQGLQKEFERGVLTLVDANHFSKEFSIKKKGRSGSYQDFTPKL